MIRTSLLLGKFSVFLVRAKQVKASLFEKHLLLTNLGLSFTLSAAGDIAQQEYLIISGSKKEWDLERTRVMSNSGLVVGGCCHYWYLILDRLLPSRSLTSVVKKVLLDQFVGSPVFILVFFLAAGFFEGKRLESIFGEALNKGWRLYLAEWVIWPPAQFINFYILPTRYRVLYDNSISLVYDIYTSYVKNDLED